MDVSNAVYTASYGDMVPFELLCGVRTKPLVVPLYVIICPIISFEGIESLYTWHGHSFVVKCGSTQKSAHSPFWQICEVLHTWVLFCETTVYQWLK